MGCNDNRNRIASGGKPWASRALLLLIVFMAALLPVSPLSAQTQWTPMQLSLRIKVLGPTDWIDQDGNLGLRRTRDSGEHWEAIPTQPPDSADYIASFDWRINGRGLVAYTHVSSKRDSVAYILARTTDDGISWRFSSFRVADRFAVAPSTRIGRFVGGADSVLLVSGPDGIYRTADDGAVFTRCTLPFSDASLNLYGDVDNLWIFNGYKRDRIDSLAVSTDGGLNWHVDQAPVQSGNLYTDWRGHAFMWSEDTLFVTSAGELRWHRIPLPVDGHMLAPAQPSRSFAVFDTSDVWMVHENYQSQRMYITRDGGGHWVSMDARGHLRLRLDPERVLLDEYLLTIPERQPLTLTATNRSSFTRSEALLEWNDPGVGGQISGYTLERAGEDSVWTPVAIDVQPPDQFCYVAQPDAGRPVFRYRLTMQALSGEVFTAVSDTVSMLPGAYVDVLDAILPDSTEDQQLVYEYYRSWRYYVGPQLIEGDTTFRLSYTFLPAERSSPWVVRYPMRMEGNGPSGEHWTSWPWIDAYSTSEGYFQYSDTSRGSIGYGPLCWSNRWFYEGKQIIAATKNQRVPVHLTGIGRGDSLSFDMVTLGLHGGEDTYGFVCRPVDGIIQSAAGGRRGSYSGQEFSRMTLLRTVNGVADMPAAEDIYIGSPYPNPVTATAVVPFVLAAAGHVRLTVHDLLGREVARIVDETREAGRQQVMLDARAMRPGAYLLRLQVGGSTATRLFIRP